MPPHCFANPGFASVVTLLQTLTSNPRFSSICWYLFSESASMLRGSLTLSTSLSLLEVFLFCEIPWYEATLSGEVQPEEVCAGELAEDEKPSCVIMGSMLLVVVAAGFMLLNAATVVLRCLTFLVRFWCVSVRSIQGFCRDFCVNCLKNCPFLSS